MTRTLKRARADVEQVTEPISIDLEDTKSDQENEDVKDIDLLQEHGINALDIKKLKVAGICTIKGVVIRMKRKLIAIKGMTESKVDKIKEIASKIYSQDFVTANQLLKKRKMVFRISTGSSDFDALLGGGIESMVITEVFGEFRTGKTQISHTLCVTTQMSTDNFVGGKVMFVDTEQTFRPNRIEQIATHYNLDPIEILENILYIRCFTSEDQIDILDKVACYFYEGRGAFKLLIIDSVMALFRTDYSGRGELSERQNKLGQYLSRLQKLAEEYNIAVFITNQMTADPGANMTFQADPKKPIGGHVLAHASTVRLSLKKGRGDTRIVKIYDSPDLPESDATFAITNGGVTDAKE